MKIWIPKYGFHEYGKNELFPATLGNLQTTLATKIWIPHAPTVILFLLAVVARTKQEQITLKSTEKIRTVSLSLNDLVLTKTKCIKSEQSYFNSSIRSIAHFIL